MRLGEGSLLGLDARPQHRGIGLILNLAELLVLALTLVAYLAKTPLPRWYLILSATCLAALVLGWLGPLGYRAVQRSRVARRWRLKFDASWEDFVPHTSRFHKLFTQEQRGLQNLLNQVLSDLTTAKLSGREFNLIQGVAVLMDGFTHSVEQRARARPRSSHEARSIIKDFESLLDVPRRVGMLDVLQSLNGPEHARRAALAYLDEYTHFLRTYEGFAQKANGQIGDSVYREYVSR